MSHNSKKCSKILRKNLNIIFIFNISIFILFVKFDSFSDPNQEYIENIQEKQNLKFS